jgi:hypothetical protein
MILLLAPNHHKEQGPWLEQKKQREKKKRDGTFLAHCPITKFKASKPTPE